MEVALDGYGKLKETDATVWILSKKVGDSLVL